MREFLAKYNQEFKTIGEMDKVTDALVGLELIQGEDGIRVHQDAYIRQLLEDFERATGELLRVKRTPMSNASGAGLMVSHW